MLLRQRAVRQREKLVVSGAVSHRVAQVRFVTPKETDLEVAVRCDAHAVAAAAEVLAHRSDETNPPLKRWVGGVRLRRLVGPIAKARRVRETLLDSTRTSRREQ